MPLSKSPSDAITAKCTGPGQPAGWVQTSLGWCGIGNGSMKFEKAESCAPSGLKLLPGKSLFKLSTHSSSTKKQAKTPVLGR